MRGVKEIHTAPNTKQRRQRPRENMKILFELAIKLVRITNWKQLAEDKGLTEEDEVPVWTLDSSIGMLSFTPDQKNSHCQSALITRHTRARYQTEA